MATCSRLSCILSFRVHVKLRYRNHTEPSLLRVVEWRRARCMTTGGQVDDVRHLTNRCLQSSVAAPVEWRWLQASLMTVSRHHDLRTTVWNAWKCHTTTGVLKLTLWLLSSLISFFKSSAGGQSYFLSREEKCAEWSHGITQTSYKYEIRRPKRSRTNQPSS